MNARDAEAEIMEYFQLSPYDKYIYDRCHVDMELDMAKQKLYQKLLEDYLGLENEDNCHALTPTSFGKTSSPPKCQCGCGEGIIHKKKKLLNGHVELWIEKQQKISRLCACGCNQEIIIKRHHIFWGIPKYILNHYQRIHPTIPTEEQRRQISKRQKENNVAKRPEVRKKMSLTRLKNPQRYWLGKKRPDMIGNTYGFKKGVQSSPVYRKYVFKKGKDHPAWDGGKSYFRGSEWYEIRKQVWGRDNYICQNCGKTNCIIHAHHKIPWDISHDNSLDNLITLCRSCHKKEEWKIIKERKQNAQSITGMSNF